MSYIRIFLFAFIGILGSCKSEEGKEEISRAGNKRLDNSTSGMILIPGGEFMMGANSPQSNPDEYPKHKVRVESFYMDIHEVTNRQFQEFVEETGYVTIAERAVDWEEIRAQVPPGTPKPHDSLLEPASMVFRSTEQLVNLNDPSKWWHWIRGADWKHPEGPSSSITGKLDHPVVHVSYKDVKAFADWAGKRLPTEVEWEWASRGGLDDPVYPWGNEPAKDAAGKANFWQGIFPVRNTMVDGFIGTAPVMSYPPNGYGLYDMAGNVWEWCQDWYNSRAYDLKTASEARGPKTSFDPREPHVPKRVIRGGSFLCNDSYCSGYRVTRRMKSSEDSGLNHTGFRLVRDLHQDIVNR